MNALFASMRAKAGGLRDANAVQGQPHSASGSRDYMIVR